MKIHSDARGICGTFVEDPACPDPVWKPARNDMLFLQTSKADSYRKNPLD